MAANAIVCVATPAAAAAADSLYYWNPKDNTRHNADEAAAHLLDSSPNLIAGLPNPLAADPLPKKTSDDLLDLGWCVIDSSESNMSECDLPPPTYRTQRANVTGHSQRANATAHSRRANAAGQSQRANSKAL
jgi:hypothetical protein